MNFEFDHLFVFTEPGAPALEALLELGLREGSPNVHPGQGTANRRIFFHNGMLEFLWVHDAAEVQSDVIAPTKLWERSRPGVTGFSPFGLSLRWREGLAGDARLPFATWPYRPPYLPPTMAAIEMAAETFDDEPLVFLIPFGQRPDTAIGDRRQPLDHPSGWQNITALRLTLTGDRPLSPTLAALQAAGIATFQRGPAPLAEIEIDGGRQGQRLDLRPSLPLCLSW
ncbi:VOC family protein [Geitlerinema sp. PCC 7407]|uniref:VOC family protein n=1 Tax=Geitlerinema sp. PCC 7407 TaxID=1173025 RepID=UPI00029FD453|nr:VOC family protein [Geitlerinema sp. PCC 7407]AFY67656.1 hypothetical protein GEI7407_3188 [Geitlerinema sp. PCC 7407]